jgi:lipoprotein NlpI
MKKIILSILTVTLLFLSGCSKDSNNEASNDEVFDEPKQNTVEMKLNTEYLVNKGDKFLPNKESEVIIEHTLDESSKRITILSGSAVLLKEN